MVYTSSAMPLLIRVPLDFQAAVRILKAAMSDSTGVSLEEYSWDADRLNDALSDVFPVLWSRDQATIVLTLFERYLPYPEGDSRNAPPTQFECRVVPDTPGPMPEPGDASVPWMWGDDMSEVVDAVDWPICLQVGIQDMYEIPGLKDVVREHARAAYRDVLATGEGHIRFVAETPDGPKPVALRIVRRTAT
jgi:hypothetical protein